MKNRSNCDDCGAKPGWHQLTCPRAIRTMQAMARRLHSVEREARKHA
jgi:hypothetical protein